MARDNWQDMKAIHSRLDSTVMFTLIRFIFAILKLYLSNGEICLVCVIALLLTNGVRRVTHDAHSMLLFEVMDSLGSAVLSQAIINIATADERLMQSNVTQSQQLLLGFTVVSSLLLVVTIIPRTMRQLSYIDRSITLLLYMYTDATQYMIQQLDVSRSAGVLSVLLYMILSRFKTTLKQFPTVQYLVKAINMVSINILLESISRRSGSLTDQHTRAFLLVVTLFVIDALNRVTMALNEGRDFAIWKGALQIFNMYIQTDIDITVTLFAALLVLVAKHAATLNNSTLVELYMLITVNVILHSVSTVTDTSFSLDSILILFVIVLAIHSLNHVMQSL